MFNLVLWYFYGFFNLGGWVFFLLLAVAVTIWIWYDSLNRNLKVWGWRFGSFILFLLLLPTLLFRFTIDQVNGTAYISCVIGPIPPVCPPPNSVKGCCALVVPPPLPPLLPYFDIIFYLGLFSGLLALLLLVAYYVRFQSVPATSPRATYRSFSPGAAQYAPRPYQQPAPVAPMPPPLPQQPPAQAWLASRDGRTYQLYRGETLIGRSADNHIYITDDTTVSKVHAKIVEQNNHFRLYDLGSTNGTRVNGQWVRQPVLLQSNDEIQLGDRTVFRFIKT
jgi:hypothetical protein